ncbi:hypothetical protein WJR50_34060 [Catalinimonas sp. 4WD22]|uniref:hypothetical protein n=1 Tax=Catalinimonas locisalis TaxID=3133978 RepID=UPI003101524D
MKINIISSRLITRIIFLISFTLIFVASCDDEFENKVPSIAGYYRVESLIADKEVDLNNDGILSTNLMEQISQSNFYGQYIFDKHHSYLEIRPTKYNDNPYQHISIPFPDPHFSTYTNSPNGAVIYLRNGLNGVGYEYTYNAKTKTVHIDRTKVDQNTEEKWGGLVEIHQIEDDKLELLVSKNYYDFSTASWLRLQITGIYSKIDDIR